VTLHRPDLPILTVLLLAIATACARPVIVAPEPAAGRVLQLAPADVTALAELLRMEDARVLDASLVSRHMNSATGEVRARAALAAAA